mmetsp:Transcript_27371/g.49271  ORF Transcript_27371/g.49271 Transcript_27371/m.49271 type:complete len:253 (-) Transcript_27371:258-1016(-)
MAELSLDEQELYDRQIRLWGLETQKKLQQTTIKVYNCDALGCEVAKNAVLSGLNVILVDTKLVTQEDVASNFFFSADDVGQHRAQVSCSRMQDMNSCVKVSTDPDVEASIIIGANCSLEAALALSERARSAGSLFYWALLRERQGCTFKDAGAKYAYKLKADSTEKSLNFKPLAEVLENLQPIVESQSRVKGIEVLLSIVSDLELPVFYPTVSILGGLIVQDIVRSLSHIGEMLGGLLVVDTTSGIACTFAA